MIHVCICTYIFIHTYVCIYIYNCNEICKRVNNHKNERYNLRYNNRIVSISFFPKIASYLNAITLTIPSTRLESVFNVCNDMKRENVCIYNTEVKRCFKIALIFKL